MVISWQEAISYAVQAAESAARSAGSTYSQKESELATQRAQAWTRIAEAINRREVTEALKS